MGCCGCTNSTSVVTAGILALLQSAMGLVFNVYFLALYFGCEGTPNFRTFSADQEVLLALTSNHFPLIRGLLVTATVLHIAWLMSSIGVLVGNSRDNVNALRQWIVVTVFIIIGDITLPIIFLAITIQLFMEANVVLQEFHYIREDRFEPTASSYDVLSALWKYYIILVFNFSKFGLITLVTNICLCIYTKRRIDDMTKPITQHVPASVPVPYGSGAVQVFPLTQQYGFPNPQQQGYPMPQSFKPVKPQPIKSASNNEKF